MLDVAIKKDFGKFKLDVNFKTDDEVMALFGASAAGKSLTLKMILGIVKPDEGRIVLDDRVLFDSEKKINVKTKDRRIAYLFQDYALFPNMSVRENVKTGFREKVSNMDEIVDNYLKDFSLYEVKDRLPGSLSGGQKQRVALLRILVNDAKLLLLDEPFSSLDSYLSWLVEEDVRKFIFDYNIKSILVSHDREEVYRMCDSIVVIDGGKSYPKLKKVELFTNPKSLPGALLTGIKNFTKFEKVSDDIYFAKDWGINLKINSFKNCDYLAVKAENIEILENKDGENCFKLEEIKRLEEINKTRLFVKDEMSNEGSIIIDLKEIDESKLNYFRIKEENLLFLTK